MCGITGWVSWENQVNSKIINKMNYRLKHRGPDFGKIKILDNVVLGHRRLSILDLSEKGNQPMSDKQETIWIVFNGEVYNFLDLKCYLQTKGFKFFNNTDTEVIINAYKFWGLNFIEKLNGMFALAIWDVEKQQLILARDRMGEKPLYYYYSNGDLIFSSELMSLIEHPIIQKSINNEALFQYMNLNYTLTDNCMIKDVKKLPPASILILKKFEPINVRLYWDLSKFYKKDKFRSNFKELKEEFTYLLDQSVKKRMIADVPIGAFLSGGIDSSAVVSSMTKFASEDRVKTFSAAFASKSFNELDFAREISNSLNIFHKDKLIETNLITIFENCIKNMCEPMADTSILPTFELSKFVRSFVKVALTGDGADEILAGYETYKASKLHVCLSVMPNPAIKILKKIIQRAYPTSHEKVSNEYKLKKFLGGYGLNNTQAHFYWKTILEETEIMTLLNKDLKDQFSRYNFFESADKIYREVDGCSSLDKYLYIDCKTWLPNDILVKTDRASMSNSLETRAPFLDHNIVEFCAQIPEKFKLNHFKTKYILRKSQKNRIPKTIINRKKKGFNAPISAWLLGELYEYARDLTSTEKIRSIFDKKAIDNLWNNHIHFYEDNGYKIFGILCLSKWLHNISIR